MTGMENERPWPLRPVSDTRLAVLYQQLGGLLDSGVGVIQALRLVARRSPRRLHDALAATRFAIESGATLGDAMAADSRVFPEAVRAFVVAGEKSSSLPLVFAELAASIELRLDTRRRIIRACIYPFTLFTVSFFILPFSKLVTDGIGAYLRASVLPYAAILAGLAAMIVLVPWGLRAAVPPVVLSRIARRVPLVGGLHAIRIQATFARHLALALRSGLEVFISLQLAARATGDADFEARIAEASRRLRAGSTLEDALAATGVFDEAFLLAVAGGEASGRLDVSLEQQARLGRETMLHRLEILVLVGAFAVLFAVYAFVAWRVYLEYKKILGTDLGDIEKLLNGTDPMKLLEGLDPTRRLPPELR